MESAGARVVPVDYRQPKEELAQLLGQLNGIYIPGDSMIALDNPTYMQTVFNILQWAKTHNDEKDKHFPLLATQYGYLAIIKLLTRIPELIVEVPKW